MNVWTVSGNLGQDPKVRTTQAGDSVLNLNLAVSQRVKRDGAWTNDTLWVDVTLFGKRAQGLAALLSKGMRVGATGALGMRHYEARDGTQRTALELIATDIEPLESRDGARRQQEGAGHAAPPSSWAKHRDDFARPAGTREVTGATGYEIPPDDDIPF